MVHCKSYSRNFISFLNNYKNFFLTSNILDSTWIWFCKSIDRISLGTSWQDSQFVVVTLLTWQQSLWQFFMVYVLYGMLVLKKVLWETNSLVAWNLTRDTSATWHPHAFILNQIKAFAREQWQLYFTHTMQEGNQCANWLAKHGSSSGIYMDTLGNLSSTYGNIVVCWRFRRYFCEMMNAQHMWRVYYQNKITG